MRHTDPKLRTGVKVFYITPEDLSKLRLQNCHLRNGKDALVLIDEHWHILAVADRALDICEGERVEAVVIIPGEYNRMLVITNFQFPEELIGISCECQNYFEGMTPDEIDVAIKLGLRHIGEISFVFGPGHDIRDCVEHMMRVFHQYASIGAIESLKQVVYTNLLDY